MIYLISMGILLWVVISAIKTSSAKRAEARQQAQMARVRAEQMRAKAEQQRIRDELKAQKTSAEAEIKRRIALEREQIRLAKEQQRQAEILKKHDEEIAKLTFKVEQATSDIEFITEQLSDLYALLDIAENQQMMAVPGSKADVSAQNKVISLKNRIRTAEKKLDKAKFDKEQAERKIA